MAERKYEKYIITKPKPGLTLPEYRRERSNVATEFQTPVAYLDGDVLKGAFYVECDWFWKGTDKPNVDAHTHSFDEVIAFFGTNPDDIRDLGGEVELWIDGEKNLIDRSFMAFVPAGVEHCPLRITRIERPIFHFTAGPGEMYE